MKQCNATGEITWPNIVVVQEISPKTVRRHPTQAVKAVSIACLLYTSRLPVRTTLSPLRNNASSNNCSAGSNTALFLVAPSLTRIRIDVYKRQLPAGAMQWLPLRGQGRLRDRCGRLFQPVVSVQRRPSLYQATLHSAPPNCEMCIRDRAWLMKSTPVMKLFLA